MRLPRASGVLLHPTSLPGRFESATSAPRRTRSSASSPESGQRWWQILPLGPTGFGNSPYQSYSSHAGNPLLINPDLLIADGWLKADELSDLSRLARRSNRLRGRGGSKGSTAPARSVHFPPDLPGSSRRSSGKNADWLDDYALFMALKEANGGRAWYEWEPRPRQT